MAEETKKRGRPRKEEVENIEKSPEELQAESFEGLVKN
jgi:hypothetical protein